MLARFRHSSPFVEGFLGLLPLWTGAIPVGIAYGVAATGQGLNLFETQVMSLTVFSASAQMSALSLLGGGAPLPVLIGLVVVLNAQLFLLSLTVGRQERPGWFGRFVGAYFLTDGAYGVAVAGGKLTLPRLIGAGVSMFLAWNLGTGLGAVAGNILPDPRQSGIDFVAPLTFLAVLVPLVRTRAALLTALIAGLATLILVRVVPSGIAVLIAGLIGSATGAWWTSCVATSAASGVRP